MSTSKYPNEIKINPNQGGKAAIERLVEAYGFTTRQALADHLDVSKSTLANRYMRDTFPADWIIQCALETGISLSWLASGVGSKNSEVNNDVVSVIHKKIIEGVLHDENYYSIDKALLPKNHNHIFCVSDANKIYIVESEYRELIDGEWLVEIEGKVSIRTLTRIPVGKIKVSSTLIDFECPVGDIKVIAKCRSVLINYF
ncbi:TPA: phage repressor protein CI [Enterobacter hormaechei subsp. steigerwaltii]